MPFFRAVDKLVYFAHIPKCGGSTVEKYLEKRFGSPCFLDRNFLSRTNPWSKTSPQHIDASTLLQLFPKGFFDLSFALVRSPEDRLISAFKWQRDHCQSVEENTCFSNWLRSNIDNIRFDKDIYDNHLRKQLDLMPDGCRYFKMEEGFDPIEDYLNTYFEPPTTPIGFGHEKRARKDDRITPTPDDRAIIEYLYSWDYQSLGYARKAKSFHFLPRRAEYERYSFAIKLPCHTRNHFKICGDYYFGIGLARALERLGQKVRLDAHDEWETNRQPGEIDLVIRGQHSYCRHPLNPCIYWFISNAEKVTWRELAQCDHIFVASQPLLDKVKSQLQYHSASLLPQAFDREAMPFTPGQQRSKRPVFVGTNRGFERTAVTYALANHLDISLYGSGWQRTAAAKFLKNERVENSDLAKLYGRTQLVLNDHMPSMRREGICSNRIFDALACGAAVVSDHVQWVPEDIRAWIYFYSSEAEFRNTVTVALSEDAAQRESRDRFTLEMREKHSFDARAQSIIELLNAKLTAEQV